MLSNKKFREVAAASRFLYVILFCLTMALPAQSQQANEIPSRQKEKEVPREETPAFQRYKELETKLLEEAFEQAIDPKTYIVGPGDFFSIVIWGDIQKGFQVPVTPEGMLIIPTIGRLKVDGLTLEETKKRVEMAALKRYKQKIISTNLMLLRKLRVHVTGEVASPGTYIATPIDRVSDLIYRAGGLRELAFTQKIRIKHLDGTETPIDFSAFRLKGDLNQNPFVQGGDIIIVPPVDFSKQVVKVEGMVKSPGFYPLKEGETVFAFMSRHDLLDLEQKITNLVIRRRDGQIIPVNLTNDEAHKTVLQNGDVLEVPQDVQYVYVVGAVRNPGRYNYVNNLLVKDYVGLAGSNENAAGLNSVRVRHAQNGRVEKGANIPVHPGDVIEVPIRGSRKLSEYLQIAGQLAYIVFAYFVVRK